MLSGRDNGRKKPTENNQFCLISVHLIPWSWSCFCADDEWELHALLDRMKWGLHVAPVRHPPQSCPGPVTLQGVGTLRGLDWTSAAEGFKDFSSSSSEASKSFLCSCTRSRFIQPQICHFTVFSPLRVSFSVLLWFGFCLLCVCSHEFSVSELSFESSLQSQFGPDGVLFLSFPEFIVTKCPECSPLFQGELLAPVQST